MPNRTLDIRVERSGFMRIVGTAAGLAIVGMIVGTLFALRDILIPLTLAAFLSFVLAPLVTRLKRWRVPKGLAVPMVVLAAFAGLGLLGYVFANQVGQLAAELPSYRSTLHHKLSELRGKSAGKSAIEGAVEVVQGLVKELNVKEPQTPPPPVVGTQGLGPQTVNAGPVVPPPPIAVPRSAPLGGVSAQITPEKPLPVEIVDQKGPIGTLSALIAPLLHPLATSLMIVIFVAFILAQREDLRNRFVKLVGGRDLPRTTAAIDDAVKRLSRLFSMQLLLNATFGVVIGVGLWLIGVPNSLLWGVLAAVMRFVPYIGAFISAALPLALAIAVDPGWSMAIMVALLFVVVEPLVGHVLEPLVLGRSTGLSPIAVVVSATFWTWLWGPVGLIMATPLTVCLVVLGKHIEGLRFLDTLLGDKPALTQAELFYQRMLVGDPIETMTQIETFSSKGGLLDYYDDVAFAGLRMAQHDLDRAMLDGARARRVRATVQEMFDGLQADIAQAESRKDDAPDATDEDHAHRSRADVVAEIAAESKAETPKRDAARKTDGDKSETAGRRMVRLDAEDLAPDWRGDAPVLVIGGRTALDEAAAIPLADALTRSGVKARYLPAETLRGAGVNQIPTEGVRMIVLSFLDDSSESAMRFAARRVKVKAPGARVVLGVWAEPDEAIDRARLKEKTQVDFIATTAREAHQYATLSAVTGETLDDLDAGLVSFGPSQPKLATSAAAAG